MTDELEQPAETTEEETVEIQTIDAVCGALDTLGLPWANTKFQEGGITPPFILLVAGERDGVFADNVNWPSDMNYTIYLVTENRDYALEKQVGDMLTGLEIAYSMGVGSFDDEDVVQAYFQFSAED